MGGRGKRERNIIELRGNKGGRVRCGGFENMS